MRWLGWEDGEKTEYNDEEFVRKGESMVMK